LKTCFEEDLLDGSCGSNHLPHLHYHLREILQILR
jgi:hypothetical protein